MIPFLYQLQGHITSDFKIGVFDADMLSKSQIADYHANGKEVYAYISIGEAENYRDYWGKYDWDNKPPAFLLNENPNWPGNYTVKFWDPLWQQITMQRLIETIEKGFDGVYLDVIDVYYRPEIINALPETNVQTLMQQWVIGIARELKYIDPTLKVIPQNALELLDNAEYMSTIDGVGVEELWFNEETLNIHDEKTLHYLSQVSQMGKEVLVTEYITNPDHKMIAVNQSIANGFIPFIGNIALNEQIDPYNALFMDRIMTLQIGDSDPNLLMGTINSDTLYGGEGADTLVGNDLNDYLYGNNGFDQLLGGNSDDFLKGGKGNDSLRGNSGNDLLKGNKGEDVIFGGKGDDTLIGGNHNDILDGQIGNDLLTGDLGMDLFIYNNGMDIITDFTVSVDQLQLSSNAYSIVIKGDDIQLVFSEGNSLTLLAIDSSDLATIL